MGSRNLYIDMLRGVAITLVMLLHFQSAYGLIKSPLSEWFSRDFLASLFYNGNYGVSIFFVISGFLITGNVRRRYGSLGDINVKHFYLLRFFRLAPSVWMALVIITALGLFGVSHFMNAHRGDEIVFMYGYLSCFDQIAFGCLAAILGGAVARYYGNPLNYWLRRRYAGETTRQTNSAPIRREVPAAH